MTADERSTLEQMAENADWKERHDNHGLRLRGHFAGHAAAIRSALAEIDALRSQVATLTDARNELQDLFNICDGERLFLKEQVATLTAERDEALARAIPKAWVATDTQCELHHWNKDDRVETNVFWGQLGIEVVTWRNGESARTKFPTLRDALDAAAKEMP